MTLNKLYIYKKKKYKVLKKKQNKIQKQKNEKNRCASKV